MPESLTAEELELECTSHNKSYRQDVYSKKKN